MQAIVVAHIIVTCLKEKFVSFLEDIGRIFLSEISLDLISAMSHVVHNRRLKSLKYHIIIRADSALCYVYTICRQAM